MKHNYEKVKI